MKEREARQGTGQRVDPVGSDLFYSTGGENYCTGFPAFLLCLCVHFEDFSAIISEHRSNYYENLCFCHRFQLNIHLQLRCRPGCNLPKSL